MSKGNSVDISGKAEEKFLNEFQDEFLEDFL